MVEWCCRQIAPSGHLLVAAPISWEEHDQPREDLWRFTPDGMHVLLSVSGLEVLEIITERTRWDERNQVFAVAQHTVRDTTSGAEEEQRR